jgi:anaerobic glycerol-3-phosphate dehydrogenase
LKEFDVIVIGGGMIGLAFTLELSRKKKTLKLQSLRQMNAIQRLVVRSILESVQ